MRAWGLLVLAMTLVLTATPAAGSTAPNRSPSEQGTVRSGDPLPVTTHDVGPVPGAIATDIRWTRWSRLVVYGGRTTLQGQVVTDDGAVPDAEVDLYARRAGASRWRQVGTTVSSASTGVFAFGDHAPSATSDYRVVFAGDLLYAAAEATRRVPVARRVRDTMRRIDANHYRLRGSVAPAYRGRVVLLQRKTCARCAWSTQARGHTSSTSRWRFRVAGPTNRRTWYFRAVVPADSRFVRSYGDHVWTLRRR